MTISGWVLGSLVVLGSTAALGAAHVRNYQSVLADQVAISCVDDKFLFVGGVVGGTLNMAAGVADPFVPDPGGTCYRANHLLPNANGDLTFGIQDTVQTNVGGCVAQDIDDDGGFCDDDGDVQVRFCNSVTINAALPLPGLWRFQDAPGLPARTTWVVVNPPLFASALLPFLPDCGAGVDAFGTAGNVNHT